ncbi:hypothetical protein [Brumimicrobium mesophilum]|uniref:hypothetical protein n=1 Tax=Brumimicrobium mesophilum TaxID=392717 RepID=UPI00131B9F74|nr:hypothetical protein [Brumimicrobium mesophilum]
MRWSYYFKHWFTTVVLGSMIFMFLNDSTVPFSSSSFEWFLIYILFSAAFSFPTFTILAVIFQYFDDIEVDLKTAKAVLISLTSLGVVLTQLIMTNDISFVISFSYSIAAIISGMLFKLRRKVNQEDIPNQSKITQNED